MNPSRIFILRPVATSLLMVGLLLAGAKRVVVELGRHREGAESSAAMGEDLAAARRGGQPGRYRRRAH